VSSRVLRFVAAETDAGAGVLDRTSGELVAHTTPLRALELAQLLNALRPTPEQIAVLLGDGDGRRLLRRLELRHDGVCSRCGASMQAGSPALWHRTTKLVRHVRRCPQSAVVRRRGKAA
jgi:hypothetical protein